MQLGEMKETIKTLQSEELQLPPTM